MTNHQAARDAVDAIDAALTKADHDTARRHWPTWLRPHRDHTSEHRDPLKALYSPAPALNSPSASQPQGTRATTLRPPRPKARKRPPPHLCENGLRPAKTLVGTTGFEPATP